MTAPPRNATRHAPHADALHEGFRAEYFEELASLEPANFWFRSRNVLIVGVLRRHFPHLRSFLEVGCGTGFVLSGIASAFPLTRVVGVDAFADGLVFAKARVPEAELRQIDARRLPYDAEFDAVGAFDVLEHIRDDDRVLAELGRALTPGGGLVITVPQHPWFWSEQDELVCHVRRYSAAELRRKVEQAGFEVVDTISFMSLLFPALWLARARGRGKTDPPDGLRDLKIPRLLNAVFGTAMAVERLLIRLGVRFVVGSSLLVVARKK